MSRPQFFSFFFLSVALTLLPNLSHIFFPPFLIKEGENESHRRRLGRGKEELGRKGLYICCHKSNENTFYSLAASFFIFIALALVLLFVHTDTQTT